MKITIIGAGNMGGATAVGLAASGRIAPGDVTVTARHLKSLARFRRKGIQTSLHNAEAVRGADIVFFAVKPWQMEGVLAEVRSALDYANQLLVSIAPGVSAADLLRFLDRGDGVQPSLAYVIPNTAIEIGQSMTFIAPVTASDAQLQLLQELFSHVGQAEVVPPEQMLAGTKVASCGIAYAMRYISASAEGARTLGLSEEKINAVVCQTVKGAAELIDANGTEPETEIDRVTTPNGMTLKGLAAMESAGFSEAVRKGLAVSTGKRRRIVVKVGSNVLTRSDHALDTTRVSAIVDQIVEARRGGCDVVLVTSGAVACGRALIPLNNKLDEVQQRQLYSAVGQVRLMDLYYKLFMDYGINVGQVLTMRENFTGKRQYTNQKNCMETMLQSGVLPVVNENDTVSITELMFTDNDELSGLVAEMVGADTLILLTNVDGVYDGDPADPASKVIRSIRVGEDASRFIQPSRSSGGRGGMQSKYRIAARLAASGTRVIIANGTRERILTDLLTDPDHTVHTEFTPE